ncbi:hypothetical protein JTB14_005071 [Gonioctena quinquepunctata]|nr:hypothetical protein JTB14_005071 [Gonioctena quinquepunctata]
MKFLIALCFLTFTCLSWADELSDCKCWSGYEPHKDQDGVNCYGIMLLHTKRCNEPQPPKCVCSGEVTGILSDSTGIWCSQSSEGKIEKKWACENKEEWDKYYKENPSEKP